MALSKAEMIHVLEVLAKMPEDDLAHAESIINSRKTLLKQLRVSNFQPGQLVRFPDKNGADVRGRIKRVNRYTVLVDIDGKSQRMQVDQIEKVKPQNEAAEDDKRKRQVTNRRQVEKAPTSKSRENAA